MNGSYGPRELRCWAAVRPGPVGGILKATMGETMRQARTRYFAENKFGDDGGYGAKFVEIKLGPIPVMFPNAPARVKAVKFHDLHHVLTDYQTDFIGELEISGWEIGAGCDKYPAAWLINLGGMAAGALLAPRKVFRAFRRGCASKSLYAYDFEPLLDREVAALKREVKTDAPVPKVTVGNAALYVLATRMGMTITAVGLALALTPFSLLAWAGSYRAWKKSLATPTAGSPAPASPSPQ